MDQNCKLCIPLEPKFNILKDFLNSVHRFSKIKRYLGSKGPKISKRGHFMDAESIPKS